MEIKAGECQTLLGPNASGKSTLAQVILGNPKYKIIQGKISEEELNYLRMRGLTEKQAINLIINGFLEK